jgi:hypothetical protein
MTPPVADAPAAPVADGPPLSRRVPGAAFTPHVDGAAPGEPVGAAPPPANGERGSSLTHRTPGAHLSHKPAPPSAPQVTSEPRPRPERVHDLLSRHLRGIREGRTGVAPGDGRTDEPLGREDDQ